MITYSVIVCFRECMEYITTTKESFHAWIDTVSFDFEIIKEESQLSNYKAIDYYAKTGNYKHALGYVLLNDDDLYSDI